MSKLSALLAAMSLLVGLATAGCDDESSCPDDECMRPTGSRPAPDEGTLPDLPRCADACKNLLGECDAQIEGETLECERSCRADFTREEIGCLAELSCGDSTDVCLD
jgi:hypothetical protein